ncbi:hypothetical protein HDU80_010639 [Chytriomyces hyalinus]|nr:hypothetical protein HDU80_010639 [Chytriomyces hyalinus]
MSATSEESVDQLPARVALLLHQTVPSRDTPGAAAIKQLSAAALRMSYNTHFNDTVLSWIRNNPKHPHLAAFAVASAACEYAADDLLENTLDELASIVLDASTALKCAAAAALLPPLSISVLRQDLHVDVKVKALDLIIVLLKKSENCKLMASDPNYSNFIIYWMHCGDSALQYRLLYIIIKLLKDSREILMARYELPKEILDLGSIDASILFSTVSETVAEYVDTFLLILQSCRDFLFKYNCRNQAGAVWPKSFKFSSIAYNAGANMERIGQVEALTTATFWIDFNENSVGLLFTDEGAQDVVLEYRKIKSFSVNYTALTLVLSVPFAVSNSFTALKGAAPHRIVLTWDSNVVRSAPSDIEEIFSVKGVKNAKPQSYENPGFSISSSQISPSNRPTYAEFSHNSKVNSQENSISPSPPKAVTKESASQRFSEQETQDSDTFPPSPLAELFKPPASQLIDPPSKSHQLTPPESSRHQTSVARPASPTKVVQSVENPKKPVGTLAASKVGKRPLAAKLNATKADAKKENSKPTAKVTSSKRAREPAEQQLPVNADAASKPELSAETTKALTSLSLPNAAQNLELKSTDLRKGKAAKSARAKKKPVAPKPPKKAKIAKAKDLEETQPEHVPAPEPSARVTRSRSMRSSTAASVTGPPDSPLTECDRRGNNSVSSVFNKPESPSKRGNATTLKSNDTAASSKSKRTSACYGDLSSDDDFGNTDAAADDKATLSKAIVSPRNTSLPTPKAHPPTSHECDDVSAKALRRSEALNEGTTPSKMQPRPSSSSQAKNHLPPADNFDSIWAIPDEPTSKKSHENEASYLKSSSKKTTREHKTPPLTEKNPIPSTQKVYSSRASKSVRDSPAFSSVSHPRRETKDIASLSAVKKAHASATKSNRDSSAKKKLPWLKDLDCENNGTTNEQPEVSKLVSPPKTRAEIAPKLADPDPVESLNASENDYDDPPFEMALLPLSPGAEKDQSGSSSGESENKLGKSRLLSKDQAFEKVNRSKVFDMDNNHSSSRVLNTPTLSKHKILAPDLSRQKSNSKKDVSALTDSIGLTVESAKKRFFSPVLQATSEKRDAPPKFPSVRQSRPDSEIFTASELKSSNFSERLAESRSEQPHNMPSDLGSSMAPLYKFSRLSNMPSTYMEVEEMMSSIKGIKRTRSMSFSADEDLNDTTIVQEYEHEEDFERQTVRKRSTEKKSKTSGGITYASQMTQEEIISGSPIKKALMKRRLDMANDDIAGQSHSFAPNKHARNFSSQHETADPLHDFMQQYMAVVEHKIKTKCEEVSDKRIQQARHHMNSIATIDASKALRDRCKLFESFASECSWSWRPCSITSVAAKSASLIQDLRSEGLN